jgi:hypothetical protein
VPRHIADNLEASQLDAGWNAKAEFSMHPTETTDPINVSGGHSLLGCNFAA